MLQMRFLIPESGHNLAAHTADSWKLNVPCQREERHLFKTWNGANISVRRPARQETGHTPGAAPKKVEHER